MKTLPFILPVVAALTTTFGLQPQSPDEIYGQLFRDVQLKKVFPYEKTLVDCVPKRDPAEIMAAYNISRWTGATGCTCSTSAGWKPIWKQPCSSFSSIN
jgi:alpha,alpha-trehalase